MKKLINAVDDVVKEQLEGMAVAHPEHLKVMAFNQPCVAGVASMDFEQPQTES